MSSLPVFVGIDYHQDSVQVCILDQEGKTLGNRSLGNSVVAVDRFVAQHGIARRIAIEACCGSADFAEKLATQQNHNVLLAHPGYVSRMKRSPDKTDLGDAQLLADLVRVNYLPRVWLAPRSIRELRRLVRHRANLVKQRKNVKLRIRGLLRENRLRCPTAGAWTKTWLSWLQQADLSESDRWIIQEQLELLDFVQAKISSSEAKIRDAVKDDPLVQKLLTLYGVGLITAVTLRAEVGQFDRFDSGKQLSRFCGVSPRNASSGARQADAGMIKAGNPQLRQVLIELSHRLINRGNTRWNTLAVQLLHRGKPRNVVAAALANRWVRWLYHQMKTSGGSSGDIRPLNEQTN